MEANPDSWFSAQASPYPQADPARASKNRSPPRRSLSRSASATSRRNPPEDSLSHTKSSNNRRPHLDTANRRVRFPSEVNGEQATDPKDSTVSDDLVTPESPTPSARILQRNKRSTSRLLENSPGHATPTAFSPALAQRLLPEENTGVAEEMSSGESEVPDDRAHDTPRTRIRSRRDDNIRSGIRDLLEVNREAPMVDVNTATVLESFLSQMNRDGDDRLVFSLSFVQANNTVSR